MTTTASASLRREAASAERPEGLTRRRACELLDVSRSTSHGRPRAPEAGSWDEGDETARAIDEEHLAHPEYGARKLARVPVYAVVF